MIKLTREDTLLITNLLLKMFDEANTEISFSFVMVRLLFCNEHSGGDLGQVFILRLGRAISCDGISAVNNLTSNKKIQKANVVYGIRFE